MKTYKGRGVVLHTLKYGDSSMVVYLLTDAGGRRSYMVQGVRSRNGRGSKLALFQPMFPVEFEGLESPRQQMHRFKEVRGGFVLQSLPFDVRKSTVALFMAEVLYRLVKESERNEALFDFVWGSVEALDALDEGTANFHLWFLAQLSRLLGFAPGNDYAEVLSAKVDAKLTDEFAPFIRPNQYVNYTDDSQALQVAADEIAKAGVTENLDKVGVIYDYVVNTLTYDTEKAKTVKSGYLPDIDKVLSEKKGICFDYASLMAAMLRSQGVPVKLVVGYTGEIYHAWLNVWSEEDGWVDGLIYFDGKDWKLMDPTFASSGRQSSAIMKYIGNGANYKAKYLY